ncbi:MAG: hypothetical protein KF681_15035 [Bdellovibrionaceae bacterium]|nr:hypothetical protein [Pseudobdellovibrionaceae bacterium]
MSDRSPGGLDEFGLHILSPRLDSQEPLLKASYDLWRNVWSQTFLELEGRGEVVSDDFTRQDEIVVLTHAGAPVGLVFHRFVDSRDRASLEDSYFRCWTPEAKESLCQAGPSLVIGSNITLHRDYRKSALQELPLKRLLTFASLAFLGRRRDLDAITGTMRVDKGMHDLFYECGAFALARGLLFHNVPVDLVGFFPRRRPIRVPTQDLRIIHELENNGQKKGRKHEGQRTA